MWTCHRCGKPVYFAERRQSLGFDWHPLCLKCEECGKILQPGQHAQHKSSPYCHIPCYAALFGPNLFGHGSTTESHRSFGNRSKSFIRLETELSNKVKEYNRYYSEYPRCQLTGRQVNGRLVLEGVLKVYWGTHQSIRLKQYEDNRVINRNKKALSLGFQYASVEYDSDGLPAPGGQDQPGPARDDHSLLFPPQFGDLTIHFPPGIEDSSQSGELQKWETLTTLDKESKPNLNISLLESLIENKSLKLRTRNITLQRSQSVKASSSEAKMSSHTKVKNKRFSCNINDFNRDTNTEEEKDQLLAIKESGSLNTSRDGESTAQFNFNEDELMDTTDEINVESNLDDDSGKLVNCVDMSSSKFDDDVFTQDFFVNNDRVCENSTYLAENIGNISNNKDDVIENTVDETNTADSTNIVTNCDTNTEKTNDDLQDANSNLPKEGINLSCDNTSHKQSDTTDVDVENLDSQFIESHDNEQIHDKTDLSQTVEDDDTRSDSGEDATFLSADESLDHSVNDTDVIKSVEKSSSSQEETEDKDSDNIEIKETNSAQDETNGNSRKEEEVDDKDVENNKKCNIQEVNKTENLKSKDRRPSVEFNVYKSRNPPKIKRSPEKLILSNYSNLVGKQSDSQDVNDSKDRSSTPDKQVESRKKSDKENLLGDEKVQLRRRPKKKSEDDESEDKQSPGGPRALRRRKGKMTRIRRRSSINGHWYDRETAVFTPPKDAAMSVWTTSLQNSSEVLTSLLTKYKIESEATDFGLYVVKETGERRLISEAEFPLLLRAHLGPHEDISKLYVMNKQTTSEISDKVAEFLRFSWAELRAFLNMFYEEEEKGADFIRYKYHKMKEMMQQRIDELKSEQEQDKISEHKHETQQNKENEAQAESKC